ncbi:MAG: Uncharacterised protein [Prochlorococcus marinus str. MIT 9313]|nr:MAG: Uncharacterised protein [Prochlorococcus marinus str. MIT 9313]
MTGDLNHIGLGLRHSSSNRADANLSNQLHAHLGSRVNLMKVVNQLGQILN